MLEISNVIVGGWEPAIRGMRNPMNSWEKSDSVLCPRSESFIDCRTNPADKCPRGDEDIFDGDVFCVGEQDYDLMRKLARAGAEHAKYRRMIVVYADINAPLYWWKEFDTYKVGTVANSCSTMHKLFAKEFDLEDFSYDGMCQASIRALKSTIEALNILRVGYQIDKSCFRDAIQLLPESYNQKRTVMLNYEVLSNIYRQRRNHKLDEWRGFCKWIETLPYKGLIALDGGGCDEQS